MNRFDVITIATGAGRRGARPGTRSNCEADPVTAPALSSSLTTPVWISAPSKRIASSRGSISWGNFCGPNSDPLTSLSGCGPTRIPTIPQHVIFRFHELCLRKRMDGSNVRAFLAPFSGKQNCGLQGQLEGLSSALNAELLDQCGIRLGFAADVGHASTVDVSHEVAFL